MKHGDALNSPGDESANIYHRAKYFQVVIASVGGALWLLLPSSIDARWLLYPTPRETSLFAEIRRVNVIAWRTHAPVLSDADPS